MSIPTRRLSLREPRIGQQRKPPGLDREITIPEVEGPRPTKPRSNTVSFAATTSTSALASAPTRSSNLSSLKHPISGLPQPAMTTSAQTSSGGNGGNAGDGTLAARRRSFLPQRSSWQKGGGAGSAPSGRPQLQLQDHQLQRLRDTHVQEAQPPAPQSPVLPRHVETSAPAASDHSQPHPPLSPSKISRPATSPTRAKAVGMSRLERPGSANAPKPDASKPLDGPAPRSERPGSSSTTSSQLSRPQSGHLATKAERPRSSSTVTFQGLRPQSKPTQRLERAERPGPGHTPKPDAPKPHPANATRLERSASLRQPIASRVTTTANHSRHQSHVVGLPKGHTGVKQGEGNTSSTPSLKANKPQFSTFQQHFSPKKGPKTKPPVPAASTSPTTATATAIETRNEPSSQTHPHVAALQVELLQLHLLHTDSIRARREWESSAERQLHKQHKSAVSKYRTLLAQEQAAQRYINNLALNKLAADSKTHTTRSTRNNSNNDSSSGTYDFSQQIQVLSRVIQDVATLTDMRGGRYTSCVRTFEKWFEHVARVRQGRTGSRKPSRSQEPAIIKFGDEDDACYHEDVEQSGNINNKNNNNNDKPEFIDPLSSKWKEEVAALGVKLELCARELDCLDVDVDVGVDGRMAAGQQEKGVDSDMSMHGEDGDVYPPSSALVRAVKGHKMLLASMIGELEVMSAVEADVGKLERLWVRGAVDRLDFGGAAAAAAAVAGGGKEERRPVWIVG
ncbi:hypothetical protein GX51_08064 [Blastomyces parvus]|uniref:Uncharacterized protein n=1 Tax=Blastomyces parvus TaxID=2060905 RepID=A0A2B7WHG0_9EURO|nr:hypothetical protein GX51_08064 [Blastomyces parvus]